MISVDVINVFLTAKGDEFIILLRGKGDRRTLPVSIGQLEAQSIAKEIYHASFPRPLTHDLFKSALEKLGCKVAKVVICDLIDNTFYARLFIETRGETMEIDSRPSDAIALALRFTAPIFVEEKVMDESGVILAQGKETENIPDPYGKPVQKKAPMEAESQKTTPLDALKAKLLKAIREERYEDAAKLRDEINKLTKSN
jgi:bifunctional DNase/RNase